MKIALAQCTCKPGDVAANTVNHLELIDKARRHQAEAVFFPELSLTAYEPELADQLAFGEQDPRLKPFEEKSASEGLWIGVGVPCKQTTGLAIGMKIFDPSGKCITNGKAYLHSDEMPFFCSGTNAKDFMLNDIHMALAICYEISLEEHLNSVVTLETDCYLASVAKHEMGIAAAHKRLAEIALKKQIPTLLVNAVGMADGMLCAGQSAVWDASGKLLGQLPADEQGILIYDTITNSLTS
ncbi:MAG: carbon-nitrogen hydrolase family protein [Bacteroidota bacterium]